MREQPRSGGQQLFRRIRSGWGCVRQAEKLHFRARRFITEQEISLAVVVEGKETGETEPSATGTAAPTTSRPTGSTTAPKTGTTAPGHTHSYAKADRTTPEKCACGATRGKALGHTWKNATCQAPKTCTACGATEGGKGDHTFVDGICSVCGTSNLADPRAKLARGKEYSGSAASRSVETS